MKQGNKLPLRRPPDGVKETPTMLINEISRLFAAKMKEYDNPMNQSSIRLIMISLSGQDNMTQLELVRRTHLKPPTVSVAVKRLEDAGYVSRKADDSDMRAVRVSLTDKGRRMHSESHERAVSVDRILMQGITDGESELLLSLLRKMRGNIVSDLESGGESTPI